MTYRIEDVVSELLDLNQQATSRFDLPDEEFLNSYEDKIGFKLNREYRLFLTTASYVYVGVMDPFVVSLGGDSGRELIDGVTEAREVGVPSDWLPICEDNGDYYCLKSDGRVGFWSLDGDTGETWSSFAGWVKEVWIEGK